MQGGGSYNDSDSPVAPHDPTSVGDWEWYLARDEAEYQQKCHSNKHSWKTGCWTDDQTRRFGLLVALQSGVWQGSLAAGSGHQGAEETPWDFGNRTSPRNA